MMWVYLLVVVLAILLDALLIWGLRRYRQRHLAPRTGVEVQAQSCSPVEPHQVRQVLARSLSAGWLLAALGLVCLGQYYRLYLSKYVTDAALFFIVGSGLFAWRLLRVRPPALSASAKSSPAAEARPRWWLAALAMVLAAIAWQQSAHNRFTWPGVLAWGGAVMACLAAFWTKAEVDCCPSGTGRWQLDRTGVQGRVTWRTLAVLALMALAVFFRFYRLNDVPPEMISDHAEKLYDVYDVLNGQPRIFFERNTGREPMQFYLAVALIKLFHTGLTFYTIQLTTALMGVLSVLGVYLLGREIGGHRLGLAAGFFAAVSSWGVILSHLAMRPVFAPAFTSLALWALWRALRLRHRNAWLVAGLFLGAGLLGYTGFRAMPLAAAVSIGLDAIARWKELRTTWRPWLAQLVLYGIVAALVFLPLGHYMVEKPGAFWYRSLTRVAEAERSLRGSPLQLFALTFARTLGMFNWRGDEIWVQNIPYQPSLDVVSGGLFLLGVVYALLVLSRRRGVWVAQLMTSGAILLLPSALSLAFPSESPSASRAGAALPVAAILVGLALCHVADEVRRTLGAPTAATLVTVLVVGMTVTNFQRCFVDYVASYRASAMNTGEVSVAIRGYVASMGDFDHVYMKSWPHWLDARLISLQVAQQPGWENAHLAMETQDLVTLSKDEAAPKLYLLHPSDSEALNLLRAMFPTGWARFHQSQTPGRDFVLFFAPGQERYRR